MSLEYIPLILSQLCVVLMPIITSHQVSWMVAKFTLNSAGLKPSVRYFLPNSQPNIKQIVTYTLDSTTQ